MLQDTKPINSYRWCFTLNNWTEEEETFLKGFNDMRYMVYGYEGNEEDQTKHLQGYIVFNCAKRLTGVKKLLNRAHWEIAKGSTEQNVTYCCKEKNYFETGLDFLY